MNTNMTWQTVVRSLIPPRTCFGSWVYDAESLVLTTTAPYLDRITAGIYSTTGGMDLPDFVESLDFDDLHVECEPNEAKYVALSVYDYLHGAVRTTFLEANSAEDALSVIQLAGHAVTLDVLAGAAS